MVGNTRSKTQGEVTQELEAIHERFNRSESSQLEIGSKVNLMENQLGMIARDTTSNTQAITAMIQQMAEMQRTIHHHFANERPVINETSEVGNGEVGSGSTVKEGIATDQAGRNTEMENGRRERDQRQVDIQNYRYNLPRYDFPTFEGTEPTEWKEECELYFDMFQTPEAFKSRLATMHFRGEAKDWYRSYKIANLLPPWPDLVNLVKEIFSGKANKPVDEFKRVHQTGRVEEYVKKFLQAKSRLTYMRQIVNEDFYVEGYISGLKDEIRHTIEMFNPVTVNEAVKYAKQIELFLDSDLKKSSYVSRPTQFSNPKTPQISDGRWKERAPLMIKASPNSSSSMSVDQKRALGLCFRCNEKWSQGHKCQPRRVNVISEEEEEQEWQQEQFRELQIIQEGELEGEEKDEQAVVNLCTFHT